MGCNEHHHAGVPASRRECLLLGHIRGDAASGAWRRRCRTLVLIAPTMGQADLYPVVLSESGIGKLAFIHDLLGATSLS
jgi:hypothetical protein